MTVRPDLSEEVLKKLWGAPDPHTPLFMDVFIQEQDTELPVHVSHICSERPMDTAWVGELVAEQIVDIDTIDYSSDGRRMTLYSHEARWQDVAPCVGSVISSFLNRPIEFVEHTGESLSD